MRSTLYSFYLDLFIMQRRFLVTILNTITQYIGEIFSSISLPLLSPTPLKLVAKIPLYYLDIFVKPFIQIPLPSSLPFTLSPPTCVPPTHILTILYNPAFCYLLQSLCSKGCSMYPHCKDTLLWEASPLLSQSLIPSLPNPIIRQLQIHILILCICTDIMHFNILTVSFSLLSVVL